MIRGLYASASGLLAANLAQDAIANNLANASTNAFKKDEIITESFSSILMSRVDKEGKTRIGRLGTGLEAAQSFTNMSQGALEHTEGQLDFAIDGPGFFVLETAAGRRYTRDGAFQINQEALVVDHNGNYLLDQDGERILAEDINNTNLLILEFPLNEIEKVGHNLWRSLEGFEDREELSESSVHRGYLEKSNVSIVKEMTDMIKVVRLYEAGQKMIQIQDETMSKAVNDVGRV